jgi:glutathione-independent formaldehyde dehydrogenase
MNVNPDLDCGAYGFNLGDWQGGQTEYQMVPYADFNLLKFPDKDQAMAQIKDLALIPREQPVRPLSQPFEFPVENRSR